MNGPASSAEVAERDRDLQLLARVRAGDDRAFHTLVNVYAVPLYRLAYIRTHDRALSEDVVQDVFAYFWERREQIEIQGSLKSYLYRAVINRVLTVLRHSRSQERIEQLTYAQYLHSTPIVLNDGASMIDSEEIDQLIRQTLAMLPPKTREIFMLNREQGLSYQEIAEVLNIGLPTIRNQISRATRTLLMALGRWRKGE